uniref:Entericidin EcnAB n=1 Tax=Polynucleobacter necessarius subsp. necessarius (strain STIR1) TaxID=452638 RepID=B1XV54_POLNS
MKFSSLSLISRLAIVGIAGLVIAACSSTMEGVGKDLQNMGSSMGGSGNSQQGNQSQTKGKDVVVTPVK